MSKQQYLDQLAVWEYMSNCNFAVFSAGEIARYVFGSRYTWGNSNTGEYRRALNALNGLRSAKVVGREFFIGTNQSVFWLKEKVK
jgi:hypothetical protein